MMNDGRSEDAARSLLALSMMEHLGYKTLLRLLKAYRDPVKACEMARTPCPETGIVPVPKFDAQSRARAWRFIVEHGVLVIDYNDERYPGALRHLHDPPPILFVRGDRSLLERTSVAIVGTRGATRYGLGVAGWLGAVLAGEGIPVVSGLARGIDTAAHGGCLDAAGETIAVLGTGIDIPYPGGNRRLMDRIVEAGCVVSEFPPGTPGLRHNFPRRNRIISGLSVGTVVVEAPEKSGALITAEFALEQGKLVLAVPGEIGARNSQGPHALIRDGAIPLFSEGDLLDAMGWKRRPAGTERKAPGETRRDLTTVSARILECLRHGPIHIDDVSSRCSLAAPETLDELLKLEMRGLVEQKPGKYFLLRRGRRSP